MTQEARLPRALLIAGIGVAVLVVAAWIASLFLNPFLAEPIAFPEWVLTLVLGATIGGIAARYGGAPR